LTLPSSPPTHSYLLSLHDALPIFDRCSQPRSCARQPLRSPARRMVSLPESRHGARSPPAVSHSGIKQASNGQPSERESLNGQLRSEEHTSELQSRVDLVCRLLLEK